MSGSSMSDEFDSLDAIEKAGVEAAPSPEFDHFVMAITSGARNRA